MRHKTEAGTMTGGMAIVEALIANGVKTVFGLPGAQLYPLFDALQQRGDTVRTIGAPPTHRSRDHADDLRNGTTALAADRKGSPRGLGDRNQSKLAARGAEDSSRVLGLLGIQGRAHGQTAAAP